MANWEKKSSYLLREIVKFRTYIDSLVSARAQAETLRTQQEQAAEDKPEPAEQQELSPDQELQQAEPSADQEREQEQEEVLSTEKAVLPAPEDDKNMKFQNGNSGGQEEGEEEEEEEEEEGKIEVDDTLENCIKEAGMGSARAEIVS